VIEIPEAARRLLMTSHLFTARTFCPKQLPTRATFTEVSYFSLRILDVTRDLIAGANEVLTVAAI